MSPHQVHLPWSCQHPVAAPPASADDRDARSSLRMSIKARAGLEAFGSEEVRTLVERWREAGGAEDHAELDKIYGQLRDQMRTASSRRVRRLAEVTPTTVTRGEMTRVRLLRRRRRQRGSLRGTSSVPGPA